MIADRRYAKALEVGYGAGVVLGYRSSVDELYGIDLDADPALAQAWLGSYGRTAAHQRQCLRTALRTVESDRAQLLGLRAPGYRAGGRHRVLAGRPFFLGMPAVNTMMESGFGRLDSRASTNVTSPRRELFAPSGGGATDRRSYATAPDSRPAAVLQLAAGEGRR